MAKTAAEKKSAKPAASADKVMKIDASRYNRTKFKDASGKSRHSAGNGDAVAQALLGAGPTDLRAIARDNGLTDRMARYEGSTNPGQYRMNLGNMLRGMVRKGTHVNIGGVTVEGLAQVVTSAYVKPVADAAE